MAAIGVVTLELRLENAHSLKEKRHVVESLKDRLRHKFNVAVAEIEYQELWQRSAIAAGTGSRDRGRAGKGVPRGGGGGGAWDARPATAQEGARGGERRGAAFWGGAAGGAPGGGAGAARARHRR